MISWHKTTERNSGLSLPPLLRSVKREYERSLIITFWRDVNLLLFLGGGAECCDEGENFRRQTGWDGRLFVCTSDVWWDRTPALRLYRFYSRSLSNYTKLTRVRRRHLLRKHKQNITDWNAVEMQSCCVFGEADQRKTKRKISTFDFTPKRWNEALRASS